MKECKHHPDYKPKIRRKPEGTCHQLLNGCVQPHTTHPGSSENEQAFPCPFCWEIYALYLLKLTPKSIKVLKEQLSKEAKETERLRASIFHYERHYDSEKITNSGDKLADLISYHLSRSGINPHSWAQVVGNIRAGLKSILSVYEAKAEEREEELKRQVEDGWKH